MLAIWDGGVLEAHNCEIQEQSHLPLESTATFCKNNQPEAKAKKGCWRLSDNCNTLGNQITPKRSTYGDILKKAEVWSYSKWLSDINRNLLGCDNALCRTGEITKTPVIIYLFFYWFFLRIFTFSLICI